MASPEAAKRRILPAWMAERAAEPAQEAEAKPKRRKMAALPRLETVYCMNEAELVDIALCFLAENCKDKEMEAASSEDEVPATQQVPVSHQRRAESGSDRTPSPTMGSKPPKEWCTLSGNKKAESEEKDDDDALKYVREIFFT
nr:modulator of retrovirus infection homolog [Pogona vitticeps]